jgi:glycosyltransferase involved in cell wall biosynthesis
MSSEQRTATPFLNVRTQQKKPLRGAFLNTAEAICSIHESGRMVYRCICESAFYDLEYFSLDTIDLDCFRAWGKLRRLGDETHPDLLYDYDFWVFNWHFVTMASHLTPDNIARLPAPKFTVVLELAPNDPLKLVPPNVFDGYIALDPSADATESIFPFPRPLEGDPWSSAAPAHDIPIIASFGLGTPGKGFELLVEAVNREFEQAIVRINIPRGTHVFTDGIHQQDYPKYIEQTCKKIAKPGIEIRFTYDFLSPEELLAWCATNDLNCFMYTRAQPGLSATTDQAVMSGRPLLTLSNETFRHIHYYIPPYPLMGLREAIESSSPLVRKIQRDWSRESFNNTFHRMLSRFGLLELDPGNQSLLTVAEGPAVRLLVVAPRGAIVGDLRYYARRVADCLGRSSRHDVRLIRYRDSISLIETVETFGPLATIFVDFAAREQQEVCALLQQIDGQKIFIIEDPQSVAIEVGLEQQEVILLPRQPIVPFFTTAAGLRSPAYIWLLGFSDRNSNLQEVVSRIAQELPEIELRIEIPDIRRAEFAARVAKLKEYRSQRGGFRIVIMPLPTSGSEIIDGFAQSSLVVVHNDTSRTAELEDYSCLAMATERAVVFTRSAQFPRFLRQGSYFEDYTVTELINLGVAAQIKVYYEFGEWQFAAGIQRILDGAPGERFRPGMAMSGATSHHPLFLAGEEFLRIAGKATRPLTNYPSALTQPPVLPPADPVAIAERTVGSSLFVLAGLVGEHTTGRSSFTNRLAEAWSTRSESMRLVLWNPETQRFQLPTEDEWLQIGLPDIPARLSGYYPRGGDPVVLARSSCGDSDWLLVPEFFPVVTGARGLVEMNAITEARQVGVQSAFIFHGAEPLRSRACADYESYDQYMQALLLADAIIPVSDVATFDLNDYFVQYQLAEFVPFIKQVRSPPTESEQDWSKYVRSLRGFLTEAADKSRHLTSVYYWLDGSLPSHPARMSFVQCIAAALSDCGVALVPVTWDTDQERLVRADVCGIDLFKLASGRSLWAPWIDPGQKESPPWLLIPDCIGGAVLKKVTHFGHQNQLRVATILNEPESQRINKSELKHIYYQALALSDKVIAVSQSRFQDFYVFLMEWRGKLNSAEDRFKVIALPNELLNVPKGVTVKRTTSSILRIVIWIASRNPAELATVFSAARDTIEKSPIRLKFHFVDLLSGANHLQGDTLRAAVGALSGAQWQGKVTGARTSELLDACDFTIVVGNEEDAAAQIGISLWRGIPCLVAAPDAETRLPAKPGMVSVNLQNLSDLTDAIFQLAEPEWRRALANEAINDPVRSWLDYARDIAVELATDRLSDGLHRPDSGRRPDVFEAMVNLKRRPKLSLCISTYNRAGWLEVNLRNIFSQTPEPRNDLEVLVVDNASVDHTPQVVKPYLGRSDFTYVRNPKNVGMLGNLAVTAQQAKGDYIWIIGDDDLTRAGVIERVLDLIKQNPNLGLIYMNYGYTSDENPASIHDLNAFLDGYNVLEPPGADEAASVKLIAAKCENFYTAIYSHVYKRDHGLRAYCQNISGRTFSTMLNCIPTSYYVLHYMADLPAYWIGEPALVVNSNVSWQAYGALLDLEQLPRAWDLAERVGCPSTEVDTRRANRLWLVEMMWRDIFEDDKAGNSAYFSATRVLMRLKHLGALDKHVAALRAIYQKAHNAGHPAAKIPPAMLFSFAAHDPMLGTS